MINPTEAEFLCRSCGKPGVEDILDLGSTPLANRLLTQEELGQTEPGYPLTLVLCPHCSLVQITETVAPEILFQNYLYRSSYSDTFMRHVRMLVDQIADSSPGLRRVIEVASNDGYLLQYYKDRGIPVLGVEPARNLAAVAEQQGIPTICAFFGQDVAMDLRTKGFVADVLHAHNVLAHASRLNDFVAGLKTLLAEDGLLVVEAPYVRDLVEKLEFDTIYHEHLCYFSVTALSHLFERHGLTITNVERLSIHGGSLRLFARQSAWPGNSSAGSKAHVAQLLAEEAADGAAATLSFYRSFTERVERCRDQLLRTLRQLKADGQHIAAYGASAKGSTLLNYAGIGRDLLDFVADRNPLKQGMLTPGSHLPVVHPERLLSDMPGYTLLLTWNFRDEILAQQSVYRNRGGRFIIPLPAVEII